MESKALRDQALAMAPLAGGDMSQSNAVSRDDSHPRRLSETKKADAVVTAAVAAGVDVTDADALVAFTKQYVVPFGCTDYQWDGDKMQPSDRQEIWRGFGRWLLSPSLHTTNNLTASLHFIAHSSRQRCT